MFYEVMYREHQKRKMYRKAAPKLKFFYLYAPDSSLESITKLGEKYMGRRFKEVKEIDEEKFLSNVGPKKNYKDYDYNDVTKKEIKTQIKADKRLASLGSINKFKHFFKD